MVVFGVAGVVVVVVVLVVAVVWVPDPGGWEQSSWARSCRLAMPWRRLARRPWSRVEGSARKSSSVLASAASVAEQFPPPFSAACRTVSKSPTSGPALADGISPLPELPQAASAAAAASASRPAASARARRPEARGVHPSGAHLTDRTPGARRASREGVRRGSRRLRRRCRRGPGGRWRRGRRGRAPARPRGGRRRAVVRRCPGSAAIRPRPGRGRCRRAAARPSASSPSWRSNESATWEWPIRQMRCCCTSRQRSASSVERTYSQTGSRGLAW